MKKTKDRLSPDCPDCGENMLRVLDGYTCPKCGASIFDFYPDAAIRPPKVDLQGLLDDLELAESQDAVQGATLELIDAVEKYIRQETSRSTLIMKKEYLKRLIEK